MNKPSPMLGLSSALDASRWIAALMVVVAHVHRSILIPFPQVEHQTVLAKGLYFFGSFGSEAVVIFFVISGYLVGGITSNKWLQKPPELRRYFALRFARIYTVLIPALILGAALDMLGSTYFDGAGLYSSALQVNQLSAVDLTPLAFVGNLFMLEGFHVPILGTNGPLWSLAYEWWYYCIFAALAALILCSGKKRAVAAIFLLAAIALLPFRLWLWMSIWALGIGAFHYIRLGVRKPAPWIGSLVLCVALVICRFNHNHDRNAEEPMLVQYARDVFLGLAFSFALICWSQLGGAIRGASLHSRLAGFSYSLYLVHFPLMMLLVAALKDMANIDFARQPSLGAYLYVVGITLALYVFAWIFSLFTEKNTRAVFDAVYQTSRSKRLVSD